MFVTACSVTSRLVTSSASFKEIVIDTYSENVSLIRRSVSGAREICGSVGGYVLKKKTKKHQRLPLAIQEFCLRI